MNDHKHPRQEHLTKRDRDEAVLDADDTGMLEGERSLAQEEIEQALEGNPPPARP